MLRASLDAIRALLTSTFPEVTKIYLNSVPAGFKRPSFFLQLVNSRTQHLNRALYQVTATWQVVYFAPQDQAGEPDVFDQLEATERLKTVLAEGLSLTAPDGTVFDVLDVDGGPRDSEVYLTVRLEAEGVVPEPQFDLIGDVQIEEG